MATRHNLCINPALKNNNTGWGGDGTAPVRTDVSGTGEGFGRQFAARYIDGSFARTAAGVVTPGIQYTLSLYRFVGGSAGTGGNNVYIEWTLSAGGPSYDSESVAWTALTLQRVTFTSTAPANALTAALILDGPYATRAIDLSQMLIEASASADTYFDGDTDPPRSTWDGTNGNSASTLADPAPNPRPILVASQALQRAATF